MKRIFILLAVIALVAIALFFLIDSSPTNDTQQVAPTTSTSTVEDKKTGPSKEQITPKTEPQTDPKTSTTQQHKEVATIDDWAWESKSFEDDWCHVGELNDEGMDKFERVIREHHKKQGYFYTDAVFNPTVGSDLIAVDFEEYRGYDKQTLKELGNQGDLRALTALFDKKDATNEEKYWAGYTAAIYGGTYLPNMLAVNLMMQAFTETLHSNLTSDNKSDYVKALAWSYFSAMQGDLGAWSEMMIHFEKFGRQHFPQGKLNAEDLSIVQLKADEYYQDIMTERRKRNLGNFKPLSSKISTAVQTTILAEEIALGFTDYWPEEFIPKDNDCFNRMVKWIAKEIETESTVPEPLP
jgi:hypothetical protein